jgi:hypothetical protein
MDPASTHPPSWLTRVIDSFRTGGIRPQEPGWTATRTSRFRSRVSNGYAGDQSMKAAGTSMAR